jgi:hypothetical protein
MEHILAKMAPFRWKATPLAAAARANITSPDGPLAKPQGQSCAKTGCAGPAAL